VPVSLAELNQLAAAEAEHELRKCCGSHEWARQLAAQRPFASEAELFNGAADIWWSLPPPAWLEAFRSHPRIGERQAAVEQTAESSSWSAQEQAGAGTATASVRDDLAAQNRLYESKFGFIFIVCATGKSAEELLALLKQRLEHDHDQELRVAAAEQARITELRLRKLLSQ
jgi:OHCU decarboxylase